jgi:uncharacterized LabA/DUF88 family protein
MATKQKISVFIDAEYVIKSAKNLTDKPFGVDISIWDIDWVNLVDYTARLGILHNSYYYTATLKQNENQKTYELQRQYLAKLENLGLVVKLGKMTKIKDIFMQKGVDVQMAIDIVSEKSDIAVLITGDSDFEPVVEKLKASGREVFLVTFSSKSGQTPKEFIDLCSSHDVIDYQTGKTLGIWRQK